MNLLASLIIEHKKYIVHMKVREKALAFCNVNINC